MHRAFWNELDSAETRGLQPRGVARPLVRSPALSIPSSFIVGVYAIHSIMVASIEHFEDPDFFCTERLALSAIELTYPQVFRAV